MTRTIEIDPGNVTAVLHQLAACVPEHQINMYRWVLENGVEFPHSGFPADLSAGKPKRCYNNCLRMLWEHPELIYCEGYAISIILTDHAWLVTPDGNVVDPTWAGEAFSPSEERGYYGIPFRSDYVTQRAIAGHYPLINDWEHDFPILSLPELEWKHPRWIA